MWSMYTIALCLHGKVFVVGSAGVGGLCEGNRGEMERIEQQ